MPNSGANPGDSQTLLAETVDALAEVEVSTSTGEETTTARMRVYARGYPGAAVPHPGHCTSAAETRKKFLKELLPAADGLLKIAHRALRVGATTAQEIRDTQRVELWLARLVVEAAEQGVVLEDGRGAK